MLCVHPLNVLFPYRCFFLSLAVFECLTDELHLLPLSGRTIYCGFPEDFVANEKIPHSRSYQLLMSTVVQRVLLPEHLYFFFGAFFKVNFLENYMFNVAQTKLKRFLRPKEEPHCTYNSREN